MHITTAAADLAKDLSTVERRDLRRDGFLAWLGKLPAERMARSIHSSRMTARSARFRSASKYRVVFTQQSYAPMLLVAA